MRRVRARGASALGVAAVLLVVGPSALVAQVADPVAPPAREGAEAAARVPVLLVPGWSDGLAQLEPLRRRFLEAGWDSAAVATLEFRDPVGSNREHAREIAIAAAELRAATGAWRIDVVAHSMGGLALRYHLRRPDVPAGAVRRVVFLATPHFGTWSSLVAWGDGAREMYPGSDFLMTLMDGRPVPHGIEALTVRTPLDLHILPAESAAIPGVRDVEVCCPTHAGLLDDDEVFAVVEAFLARPLANDAPPPA